MGLLRGKLFGKWAGVASATASLVVAVLAVTNPAVLTTDVAVSLMVLLGVHAAASDGVTPVSGGNKKMEDSE